MTLCACYRFSVSGFSVVCNGNNSGHISRRGEQGKATRGSLEWTRGSVSEERQEPSVTGQQKSPLQTVSADDTRLETHEHSCQWTLPTNSSPSWQNIFKIQSLAGRVPLAMPKSHDTLLVDPTVV